MGHVTQEVSPEARAEMASNVVGRNLATVVSINRNAYGAGGPVVWAVPETEEEVSAVLRLCHTERWTVAPTGAGTQWYVGPVGHLPDIILSLRHMNRVLEYSPSDMVVTVQPGTPLLLLQEVLRQQGQMLPLDPVVHDDATVGGIVATAASGPRRALYGAVRDMVIGLRTVYPNGNIVRVGGKVVKNVAGYDMAKLFTGSYGTLAILTELTFKLRPLPLHRETVLLIGERANIDELRRRIVQSHLIPSRFELLFGDYATDVPGILANSWMLAVDCDENESSAAYQTEQLLEWARELTMQSVVFRGADAEEWWSLYRRPLLQSAVVIRVTAPPSRLSSLTETACQTLPKHCRYRVSFGLMTGVGHIYIEDGEAQPLAEWVEKSRLRFADVGGNLLLQQAPPAVRECVDSFGSVAGSLEPLLKGIKASIDPFHIMNPGRFVGGI